MTGILYTKYFPPAYRQKNR